MKFTQIIKDKWLEALKSGNYIQGKLSLVINVDKPRNISGRIEHCCIGVLGEIHPELSNDTLEELHKCPYKYLQKNIGRVSVKELYGTNDDPVYWDSDLSKKQDYSNVIPLIEKLEVQN